MVALDDAVRTVKVQFSFRNGDAVPAWVPWIDRETRRERGERKHPPSGICVVEPTPDCSVCRFLEEFEGRGWEMVDMVYQERLDLKQDPTGRKTYHMVRFVFARKGLATLSEEFRKGIQNVWGELLEMCRTTMWRVRVYSNPIYKEGLEISGVRSLSVNLEVRTPLVEPDGQPTMVWPRDERGRRRMGNGKIPRRASCELCILEGVIQLTPVV